MAPLFVELRLSGAKWLIANALHAPSTHHAVNQQLWRKY
jgi:hypothetical protein